MGVKKDPNWPCERSPQTGISGTFDDLKTIVQFFAGLRKLRALEAKHLPFVRSVVDLDIVIEIGYYEERGRPLTVTQLLTLGICSRTTALRKLKGLTDQGIVIRTKHARDGRASVLRITQSAMQRMDKYRAAVSATVALHFV